MSTSEAEAMDIARGNIGSGYSEGHSCNSGCGNDYDCPCQSEHCCDMSEENCGEDDCSYCRSIAGSKDFSPEQEKVIEKMKLEDMPDMGDMVNDNLLDR